MVKVALLIGVSEFADVALANLPAAIRDINAVQSVLNDAERGGFDDVRLLENPDRTELEDAIDTLFRDRQKDDLVLLYFSGHGIKDDTGKFSLATCITQKDRLRTTAVAASFVHDVMSSSRSRRQVVILDCCFSGAFATGMTAKDDASVDVKAQLGGEGRVVLTASTATQYAFAQTDEDLSIYTRFLVEGIQTGAADTDNDGRITVDELHTYAQRKVQEAAPAMKPEIYAVKEGYTIQLAKAPLGDPTLEYRKQVENCVRNGRISVVGRRILQRWRRELKLTEANASTIEATVLEPFREYEHNREEFTQALAEALEAERGTLSPETSAELKRYQQLLKLRDEDIPPIPTASNIDSPVLTQDIPSPSTRLPTPDSRLPPLASDDLSSDKGINYTKLRDLLKANQWKDADRETYLVMLQIVGRTDGDWIRETEIKNFPCTDLRTIDQLWVKYSNGHFGFSVQKQIYLDCGGNLDGSYDEKVWKKFGDRVGWRVENTWINYSEVTFDTTSQQGHLPLLPNFGPGVGIFGMWVLGEVSSLASRLVKCNL
ncbi:caspase, EACC1-associated type [Stenomitos frigidus]|uniref:caspase, EACC1-associated type n=1 Tax=Stenomitos frigidus TaxID=1886765 RepID=UPI001C6254C9|nr:GUN4 domain-containing protein [Stenomitos frigidus]